METMKSMMIAASGMRAQAERMRVIAENLANASSTAASPGEDPYRRVPVSAELIAPQARKPAGHRARQFGFPRHHARPSGGGRALREDADVSC
jgi:flagellar basal body rod protein FlgC